MVAPDGSRVAFVRSSAGDDPVHALWVLDLATGSERIVADPRTLVGEDTDADVPPEELARRERVREQGAGVVAFATDAAVRTAAFALAGRIGHADLVAGTAALSGELGLDPRPSQEGTRTAFVRDRALWVDGTRLIGEDDPDVTWGLADFVAAEELGRTRGYWWAPGGTALLAARVDVGPVARWWLSDPANPDRPPALQRYPAAGTANARVGLAIIGVDGARADVDVPPDAEYLVDCRWDDAACTAAVLSRDQRTLRLLGIAADGSVAVLHTQTDPAWVERTPGLPRALAGGRVLHAVDEDGTRRLALDGIPASPIGLQIRSVVDVDATRAVVTASDEDPTAVVVCAIPLAGGSVEVLSPVAGVADAAGSRGGIVTVVRTLDSPAVRATIGTHAIASLAEVPILTPRVELLTLGERELRAALLLPPGALPAHALPVLVDPYGGPHVQRVVRSATAHLSAQWFADAGFAVLVVDGRGTPGRTPAWEKAVLGDLADGPLQDQVDALDALDVQRPGLLDRTRVAIRGWSFGGHLAAIGILRRPDVFAAAVIGAPVTDWSLYDTAYAERYLGLDPAVYAHNGALGSAASLDRPVLLVHGLADDNVVAAHTLRFSTALLAAGRPHRVLPLSGVTHMTPQPEVAEHLLTLQLHFLREALGIAYKVRADPTGQDTGALASK